MNIKNKLQTFFTIILIFSHNLFSILLSQTVTTDIIQARITTAQSANTPISKISKLNDVLDEYSGKELESTGKETLFDAISKTFSDRNTIFQTTPASAPDLIDALTTILSDAEESSIFTTDQKAKFTDMLEAANVEDILWGLNPSLQYKDKVYLFLGATTDAKEVPANIFAPATQQKFFDQLKIIFESRGTSDQTGLQEDAVIKKLLKLLDEASKSTLLDTTRQATISFYSQTLSTETKLINISKSSDPYDTQIANYQAAISEVPQGTYPTLTQNISANSLDTLINKRTTLSVQDALAGNFCQKLLDLLNIAKTKPLFSVRYLDTINVYIRSLTIETNIINAGIIGDYNAKVKALLNNLSLISSGTPVSSLAQKLFTKFLTDVFEQRPKEDLALLQTLLSFLQSAQNTLLLLSQDQNNVRTVMIPAVNSDISLLTLRQKLNDIIELTDNMQRIAQLSLLSTELKGKNISTDLKTLSFNALQKAYDSRAITSLQELVALKRMLNSWVDNKLLDDNSNTKITTELIPQINKEINDLLKTINPDSLPTPLPPELETEIFNSLTQQYNSRDTKDINNLSNLKDTLNKWANSNKLTAAHTSTIKTIWIPQIDKDLSALLEDPTKFPTPLPPELEQQIFASLQKLYEARIKTDVNSLTNVKATLNKWADSNKLTTEHTGTINTSWIPTIDNEIKDLLKTGTVPTLDPATELKIFKDLEQQYNSRNKSNVLALLNLKTLLVMWASSNKLSPEHTNTIKTIWIPTIDKELATGEIPTIIDTPTELNIFKDLERQFNARDKNNLQGLIDLQTLLTKWAQSNKLTSEHTGTINNSWLPALAIDISRLINNPTLVPGTISGDSELNVFTELEKKYNGRNSQNVIELFTLKKLFTSWATSNKLSTDHTSTINNNWIPQLEKEIKSLTANPDLLPSPLDPAIESDIFDDLTQQYNSRNSKDITNLMALEETLTKWLNSNKLTSVHNTTIKNIWLPQIDKEIKELLKNPDALPATLDPTVEKNIFGDLEKLYNERNRIDIKSLTSVKSTLEKWGDSNKLTQEHTGTIKTVWIPTIDNEIKELLKDPTKLPTLDPTIEQNTFKDLEQQYNTRNNRDIVALINLKALLTLWANSNKLLPEHTALIKTTWLPTLDQEIKSLTKDPSLLPILTPTIEQNLFKDLERQFNARDKNNLQGLLDLQALLTSWAQSNKLSQDNTNTINNSWLPTLVSDIQKLISKPDIIPAPSSPEVEQSIFTELERKYNTRNSQSLPELLSLKTLLNNWATSYKLSGTHTNTITSEWIPQLDKEINTLMANPEALPKKLDPAIEKDIFDNLTQQYNTRNKQDLTNLINLRTLLDKWADSNRLSKDHTETINNTWIPQLDKEIKSLMTRPELLPTITDPTIETNIFGYLQKLYNSRNKDDIKSLTSVKSTLDTWGESNKLSQEHTTTIKTIWIPTIDNEIKNLLQDPTKLPTLDKTTEQDIFSDLEQKYNSRNNQDLSSLVNLRDYLNTWAKSKKLSSDHTTIITSAWLPTLAQEISALLTSPDIMNKLQAPLDPATESLIFNYLKQQFDQRGNKNPQELMALRALLSQWADSNKLTTEHTNIIKTSWIPTLDMTLFVQRLKDAAVISVYPTKLEAFISIVKDATGKKFSADVQNYFFSLLQQLVSQRTDKPAQDLNKLVELLSSAQFSSLLSPEQQRTVMSWLEGLKLEADLAYAAQLSDYGAQLDALFEFIFKYSGVKSVSTSIQNTFFTAISKVIDNRGGEYDLSVSASINVDKLAALLQAAQNSVLISDKQREYIKQYAQIVTIESLMVTVLKLTLYTDQLNTLFKAVRISEKIKFDSVTNNLYFGMLNKVFNARAGVDISSIQLLIQVLQASLVTPLLNFEQQYYVKTVMLPALGIYTPTSPLEQQLSSIMQQPDPLARMQLLTAFIKQNPKLDATGQNMLSSIITQVMGDANTQDPTIRQPLIQLLNAVKAGNVIPQSIITTTIDPFVTQLSQITGTPEGQVPAPSNAVIMDIAKLAPNYSSMIDYLLQTLSSGGKMKFDKGTQNSYAKLITTIFKNIDSLDTESTKKFYNLLLKSNSTSILADKQKKYLTSTMLPTVKKAIEAQTGQKITGNKPIKVTTGQTPWPPTGVTPSTPIAPKAPDVPIVPITTLPVEPRTVIDKLTVENINAILAQDPDTAIQTLNTLVNDNKGKKLDNNTKNALALALQTLTQKSDQLDSSSKSKLVSLLTTTKKDKLLAPAQEKYLESTLLPVAQGKAKASTIKPAVSKKLTVEDINTILAQDPDTAIQALNTLVNANNGKKLDKDTKNALAIALQTLTQKSDQLDSSSKSKLVSLLTTTKKDKLLAPAQEKYLESTLLPVAQGKTKASTVKPAVSKDEISQTLKEKLSTIDKAKTPQEKLEKLSELLTWAQTADLNANDKKLITQKTKTILSSASVKDPKLTNWLSKLRDLIAQSPFISSAQRAKLTKAIESTISAKTTITKEIEDQLSAINKDKSFSDKLARLKYLLNWANKTTLSEEDKQKFVKAIRDTIAQTDKTSPQASDWLSQLRSLITKTGFITKPQRESFLSSLDKLKAMFKPAAKVTPQPTPAGQTLPVRLAAISDSLPLKDKIGALLSVMAWALGQQRFLSSDQDLFYQKISRILSIKKADASAQENLKKLSIEIRRTPLLTPVNKIATDQVITKLIVKTKK